MKNKNMKFDDAVKNAVRKFSSPAFLERIREEDDNMLQYMDILADINRCRCITVDSQAGVKRSGISVLGDRLPYEMHERAYLAGFMKEDEGAQFIRDMGLWTDKAAVFIPYVTEKVNTPAKLDVPLTVAISGGETKVPTHMPMCLPGSYWNLQRKEMRIDKHGLVYVFCWDTNWDRDASGPAGLFTDVLRILRGIQS
jgi:hypothetical protein